MTSRRAAIGAVLAALALAGPTRAATVTVEPADGGARTVELSSVEHDVQGRSYRVRDAAGGERSVTVSGASVDAVLRAADADPFSFSYLEVMRPDGGAVLLSRTQATDPEAFDDGPPVVWEDGAGIHFLRPSGGGDDANAADAIDAPGGALTIRMKQGTLLDVDVRASRRKVGRGKSVTLSAVVRRAGAGERLRYSWYFDDGESARGRRVTHRFARSGSYDVAVGVTAPGDDVGASATVTIQVGEPAGGPDRKGGGSNPDEAAPDSGAATGNAHGGGSSAGKRARPARERAARRKDSRRRTPVAPAEGRRIAGNLLADASGPRSEPRAAAIRAARTGRPDEGGASVPAIAWQAAGFLLLLGAGAALELRPLRRRAAS